MENLRAATRANPASFPSVGAVDTATGGGVRLRTTYSYAIGKQSPPDTNMNIRKVVLTASWVEKGTRSDSLVVETYVAKDF